MGWGAGGAPVGLILVCVGVFVGVGWWGSLRSRSVVGLRSGGPLARPPLAYTTWRFGCVDHKSGAAGLKALLSFCGRFRVVGYPFRVSCTRVVLPLFSLVWRGKAGVVCRVCPVSPC